ncbi:hypothetical protein Lal_00034339 [Lupinus albus]|nr:hypothetical protein Lal_00034339 [Lupinus albus]
MTDVVENQDIVIDEVVISDEDYVGEINESESESEEVNESEGHESGNENDVFNDYNEKLDIGGVIHSDDGKVKLETNMLFLNVHHFREVLKDYVIQEVFEVKRLKKEKARVTAICAAEGCGWRIHASPTPNQVTYQIKTYNSVHNCIRTTKNSNATSVWIAKKLESKLVADPNMNYSSMKQELLEQHGLQPSNQMQLYRAKRKVLRNSKGIHASSYNDLPAWATLVRETNPGSKVTMEFARVTIDRNPQFKRLFVCLDAMKKGFVRGCRPWFGIDGCHLKGPYGGILLAAVARDGNKGIFPIAIAVVEVECKDSWRFFLTLLSETLHTIPEWKDDKLTIMSDRQKSSILTTKFWAVAMAYNETMFNKAIASMRRIINEAVEWLLDADRPKSMWARHTIDPTCKSDHVTNNVCEVFNAWIVDDRKKTILSMMESIVCRLMGTFQRRYAKGCGFEHNITPNIRKILNINMQDGRFCTVTYVGREEFQVIDGHTTFVVNLMLRLCSCNYWLVSGLPCKHVCSCIAYMRVDVEKYCDEAYYKSKYCLTYNEIIHPMPDIDVNNRGSIGQIDPPPLKRLPGRPRRARNKSVVEGPSGTKDARRSHTCRCSTCNELGHNYRTCQRAPIQEKKRNKKETQNTSSTHASNVEVQAATSTLEIIINQQGELTQDVASEHGNKE